MVSKLICLMALLLSTFHVHATEPDPGNDDASAYAKTLRQLLPAAEAGDASSQYILGTMYEEGLGVNQDFSRALLWLSKAADHGLAEAKIRLAAMHAMGRGTEPDQDLAASILLPLAEQGNADAQLDLALLKWRQILVRDYWLEQAMLGGSVDALYVHAKMDSQTAKFTQYSENYIHAYLLMTIVIDQGKTDPETEGMDKWTIRKYIEEDADEVICLMYIGGLGVPQDPETARKWCNKGIAHGSAIAHFLLGFMWEKGLGSERDAGKAKKWYARAQSAGADIAGLYLSRLEKSGSTSPGQPLASGVELNDLESSALIAGDVREEDLFIFAYQLVRHEAKHSSSNRRLYRKLPRTLFSRQQVWTANEYVANAR